MANGGFSFHLKKEDVAAVMRKLNALSDVERTEAVKKGLRAGMDLIIAAGKSSLATKNKVVTGKLKKSFSKNLRKSKKPHSAYIKGGFRRGNGYGGAAAHLIDRGTAKRWTRSGKYTGSVSKGAPNHGSLFWTSAVESKGPQAVEALMQAVNEQIIKIMNSN